MSRKTRFSAEEQYHILKEYNKYGLTKTSQTYNVPIDTIRDWQNSYRTFSLDCLYSKSVSEAAKTH